MPTIFIDNKPYEVKEGQNLLHAALSHGVDLPYFCWHPALGSVGACRQCAVQQFKDENDTKGRMVMSCMTPASAGARISIDHPECKEFRASVIEWMMTNHPHDCPVCDEGGECHLQDMTVMSGHNYRRFRFKKRTFTNQNLGPFINHEMNRCITCYRCVRFYRDVAGGTDFNSFASSNRVYFGRHEDGPLENEFSGNLVEVCPTGVFTDKPFKQYFNRKWDLQMAPSVCQLCSLGCNIIPGERYGSLRRIQNRYNHEINGYFLCDRGRFGHSFVNSKTRLFTNLLHQGNQSEQIEVNDSVALTHAKSLLTSSKRMIGIGSPRASLEANFALRTLVGENNFYDGLSKQESGLLAKIVHILKDGPTTSASIQDIEQADAIVVLGEDLTNTAPRIALAIRQAVIRMAQQEAAKLGIASWHDIAVRNFVREKTDAIFVASPFATKLDDVGQIYRSHPDHIARLGYAIAHELNASIPLPQEMDAESIALARQIAERLRNAKRPVIISGTGLGSEALIEVAANVAWALRQTEPLVRLCYALPEANSMGVALMNAKPLHDALTLINQKQVDVAVVLENDLSRRLPLQQLDVFFDNIPHIVALDSCKNETISRAELALPVCTFAESTGSLVNNEGRVQRFYSVFERKERILESWRVVRELMHIADESAPYWQKLDDLTDEMCEKISALKPFGKAVVRASFRIDGQKIPRETPEYSGRTAMHANVTMHEPAPPSDPDSPLSHSMEGYAGHPPAALTPFFWAPGWNSVQAVNKYQDEVGGDLKNDHIGVRIWDASKNASFTFFNNVPPATLKIRDQWQLLPRHHIFGSEERAPLSLALSQRLSSPYIGIGQSDADQLQLETGAIATVVVDDHEWEVPVSIFSELDEGVALFPVGLPSLSYIELPHLCSIRSQRGTT